MCLLHMQYQYHFGRLAHFSNFKRQHSGWDHDQQKWWLGNLMQHTIVRNPGHLGYPTCFKFGQAQADANLASLPIYHLRLFQKKAYSSHPTFSYTSSWVHICCMITIFYWLNVLHPNQHAVEFSLWCRGSENPLRLGRPLFERHGLLEARHLLDVSGKLGEDSGSQYEVHNRTYENQ